MNSLARCLLALGLFLMSLPVYANSRSLLSGTVIIQSQVAGDNAGKSVLYAGDMFGNNSNTLLIGSPQAPASSTKGKAYVLPSVTGTSSPLDIDSSPIIIQDASSGTFIGKVLAANGDLDGDGKKDLVVALPDANKILIYLGKSASGWGTAVSLASANVVIDATHSPAALNKSSEQPPCVSIGGDINGDGYDDLLIGADGVNKAFLILGRQNFSALGHVDLSNPSLPSVNMTFSGEVPSDHTGYSVAIVPDLNGDGLDDILVGSYDASGSGIGEKVSVFYGKRTAYRDISVEQVVSVSKADAVLKSPAGDGSDGFSERIAGLGDIDGDGYGDVLIGAPNARNRAGSLYLYYGGKARPLNSDTQTYAAEFRGVFANTLAGYHAVSSAGDLNGDLKNEFIIGNYLANNLDGRAYVWMGKSERFSGILSLSQADTEIVGQFQAQAGYSVSSAGDINKDGRDDLMVGAPGANSSKGLVSIWVSPKNTTPNTQTATFQTFNDAHYQTVATTLNILSKLYIQLNATDQDATTPNTVTILAHSGFVSRPIPVRLFETGNHTGIFRGSLTLVNTRSSEKIRQLATTPNQDITLTTLDLASSAVVHTQDSTASLNGLSLVQVSTGNATQVRIDYTLFDTQARLCTWAQTASQVQFLDSSGSWKNATLSGTRVGVGSLEIGQTHSAQFQPLVWEAGQDHSTEGTFHFRMKIYNSFGGSSYVTSNAFVIVNSPPAAPVISTMSVKTAFNITVTGNAEANVGIRIFVADTEGTHPVLSASVTANSLGIFSAFPVQVSPTRNRLFAVAKNAFGFSSLSSTIRLIQFQSSPVSVHSGTLTGTVSLPLASAPSDVPLGLTQKTLPSVTVSPPQFYRYLTVFDLGYNGIPSVNLSAPAVVYLNLETPLSSTSNVVLRRWDPVQNAWVSRGISNVTIAPSFLQFSTTHLSEFSVVDLIDKTAPALGPIRIDGEPVISGKFYGKTPLIQVALSDSDSGIATWSIQLRTLTGAIVTQNSASGLKATRNFDIQIRPSSPLADGDYSINVSAQDNSIFSTTSYVTFSVTSSQFLFDILAAPNPYNPDKDSVLIGYTLSQQADELQLYWVNLRGDILWHATAEGVFLMPGYHAYRWDGHSAGSALSNGAYFIYGVAKRHGNEKKAKFKMGVLR